MSPPAGQVRAYGWPWERKGKTMPLLVAVLAFCFNLLNAFINAAWLGHHAKFSLQHAASLDFVVGLLLWALGLAANVMCDEMMLAQRRASKRRGEGAKERAEPLRRTSSAPPHEQASKQDQPKKHVRVAAAFGYIIPSGFLFELVSAPNCAFAAAGGGNADCVYGAASASHRASLSSLCRRYPAGTKGA